MKTIDDWFDAYAESHQNKTNKLIHWFCVPAIFYSIIGLLASIPFPSFVSSALPDFLLPFAHWGSVLVIFGLIFYILLSLKMAIGIALFSWCCLLLVNWFSTFSTPLWLSSLIIFVVAWIGQFYGHKIEGKKPSFLKDLQFLLIGPAWVLAFLYQKIGISYR